MLVDIEEKTGRSFRRPYKLFPDGCIADPPKDPAEAIWLAATLTGDVEHRRANNGRLMKTRSGKPQWAHYGKAGAVGYLCFLHRNDYRSLPKLAIGLLEYELKREQKEIRRRVHRRPA